MTTPHSSLYVYASVTDMRIIAGALPADHLAALARPPGLGTSNGVTAMTPAPAAAVPPADDIAPLVANIREGMYSLFILYTR